MIDYHGDIERLEMIKQWWRKWGVITITIFIILLISIITWNSYRHFSEKRQDHLSTEYAQFVNNIAQNNLINATQQGTLIIHNAPKTVYAQWAALWLAKQAIVQKNNFQATQWFTVAMHGKDPMIADLARLNFARFQASLGEFQQALNTINLLNSDSYSGAADVLRGFILEQMHRPLEARTAYQNSLLKLDPENFYALFATRRLAQLPHL